jgi:hypothetical protein
MAIVVTETKIFTTSDGKKFSNEADANAYESTLGLRAEIDGFCAFAGIPLTVPGKMEGKVKRNPGIKRVLDLISKWDQYLESKAAQMGNPEQAAA